MTTPGNCNRIRRGKRVWPGKGRVARPIKEERRVAESLGGGREEEGFQREEPKGKSGSI